MRYLLDTNTCIGAMRNDAAVIGRMSAASPEDCAISTITTYELYTGVEKCSDPGREGAKVDTLLKTIHTLPFDSNAAKAAAAIRAALEFQGRPIGP
jgi:tRNA(fMet)-specific endonuclease VapC